MSKVDSDSDVSLLDNKEMSEALDIDKWAPQLGYAEDPETPLTADTFPSKSGGKPAWMNPEHVLNVDRATCGNCDEPLILLLQLYTPEDHPAEAFHRTVYVFCCKNGACLKQDWSRSLKVFRSQLPRENPYYAPPEDDGAIDSEAMDTDFVAKEFDPPALCVICGLAGTKKCGRCQSTSYCSRQHQLVDWNSCGHKEYCTKSLTLAQKHKRDQLRALRIFEEKEIVSEPEGKGEDGKEEEDQRAYSEANQSSSQAGAAGALVPAGEEIYEESEVDVDEAFLKFQLRIQLYPDQVIRYDRVEYDMPDRDPLWVQEGNRPTDIPLCPHCQGPRTFEFQILSTLLNFLGVSHIASDSLDWGSLFVYTCKHNCALSSDTYAEEFIWKQDFSADGMKLGPK
ncbi:programmed cell death protein 2 [Radiomyces spectabilis]|uniref:programmed cell death protein 2 n=1 Tax=Radiomyces spectabilis TaxID=64574 RepID=UPI00221EAAEA|nr:programmed cell death protein 2 [Radiomyces spectabilis]KAI8388134.1 programmed cell death protein 2 [Radiomyces spectabilis]